jgi:hypothetical protein
MIGREQKGLGLKREALAGRLIPVAALLGIVLAMPLAAQGTNWAEACSSGRWARDSHTSVVLNDTMWIMGGTVSGGLPTNDITWSVDGVHWTHLEGAPWEARYGHASVVYDDKMWVMGGRGYNGVDYKSLNDVWYSTDGDSWIRAESTANLWPGRAYPTSVVYDNKMWVMGGNGTVQGQPKWYHDVWYSTDGANWTLATDSAPWLPRYAHTSVVYDNKMWVMGGVDATSNQIYNDVWYSTDGANWTQAPDSIAWAKRASQTSVVFDDTMWLMGGVNPYLGGGTYYNDVWYSTDSNGGNWTMACSSAAWPKRQAHSSLVFNDAMWVIGGCNASSEFGDAWYLQGTTGIQGADAARTTHLSLATLKPNPFRVKATIVCEAPPGRPATVRIYSSSGALVRVLAQDKAASGTEQFEWNGTNQTNTRVPPGLYFVRVNCDGWTATQKLTKLD